MALIDKGSGEFVGQAGLILQQNVDGADETEIAYLLERKYWGNGFATEAASSCRDLAFSRFDCERVISLIDPKNFPSIRVAGRIGMVLEKNVQRWGKPVDVYSQLNA